MPAVADQESREAAMARAAASRRPPDGSSSLEERALLLHGLMSELCLAAVTFVSQAKLEETVRHWLADSRVKDDEERGAVAVGEALALALDVALFSPSASGTTAIDRFARQHRPVDAAERAALATLQRATFRILQVEASDPHGGHGLVDLATGSRFRLLDPSFPSGCEGLAVAARIATVDGDAVVTVGPVTPLDEAALDGGPCTDAPEWSRADQPEPLCGGDLPPRGPVWRTRDRRPQSATGGGAPEFPVLARGRPTPRSGVRLVGSGRRLRAARRRPACPFESWSPSRI